METTKTRKEVEKAQIKKMIENKNKMLRDKVLIRK